MTHLGTSVDNRHTPSPPYRKSDMPPRRLLLSIFPVASPPVVALVAYNADTVDAFLWRLLPLLR